jgi:hypothetical protein
MGECSKEVIQPIIISRLEHRWNGMVLEEMKVWLYGYNSSEAREKVDMLNFIDDVLKRTNPQEMIWRKAYEDSVMFTSRIELTLPTSEEDCKMLLN